MESAALSPELSPTRSASVFNLSIEEENLASIPFAVLEQRVGKRTGKLEVSGTKTLPDGTEVQAIWQVQGNNDLGLPTEQDMDIFVALGVLTFRNNFAKTVTFSGREIARILNINGVHGKFYERMKLAMDRFIPLRFRTLTQSERHEDVKWVNVFQDASFSLDRETGRCVGSITWTDKIIGSMDSGFFRLLDARRYMELDGLTTKHMYRFLAMAFEREDVVLIDARLLATRHLGMLNLPKYFSRLMQTLEPALEQLRREQVVGSWHIVSKTEWRLAIRCHANYIPERRRLLNASAVTDPEMRRERCRQLLEKAGLGPGVAADACAAANEREEFYSLERTAHLMARMIDDEVMPHVAQAIVRRALDAGVGTVEGRGMLDWMEIAVNVCAQKRRSQQKMRNGAGLIVKLIRDEEARQRLVTPEQEQSMKDGFRRREMAALRQHEEAEERVLIFEYEQYRENEGRRLFEAMNEERRSALVHQRMAALRQQERAQRLNEPQQRAEAEAQVMAELIKESVPSFEKWRMRRMARQAILSLFLPEWAETEGSTEA